MSKAQKRNNMRQGQRIRRNGEKTDWLVLVVNWLIDMVADLRRDSTDHDRRLRDLERQQSRK